MGWGLVVDEGLQHIPPPLSGSEHRCEWQQLCLGVEEASGSGIRVCWGGGMTGAPGSRH